MKLVIASALIAIFVFGANLDPVDLSEIGMTVEIPESWSPNGSMIQTTAGEFYRQVYEKTYSKPDSNRIVVGSMGYSAYAIDSTMLPDLAAYQSHQFNIEMYGYYGWYKRWLWAQGKRQFSESYDVFFLERLSDLQGNPTYEWLEHEVLADSDARKVLKDAFAIEFKWKPKNSEVAMQAQLYYIVEGPRCFRIQIGGTQLNFDENRATYEEVLGSIGFLE